MDDDGKNDVVLTVGPPSEAGIGMDLDNDGAIDITLTVEGEHTSRSRIVS